MRYVLALDEYASRKGKLQILVREIAEDGNKEMENSELGGKYLNIMFFVERHLDAHLEGGTRLQIQTLKAAAKESLKRKLEHLQSLMSSGAATGIFIGTHLAV